MPFAARRELAYKPVSGPLTTYGPQTTGCGAAHTSRLVVVTRGKPGKAVSISYPDFLNLRSQDRSFRDMLAYLIWPVDMTGIGKPQRVWATLVSANYFQMLGVRPVLGRGFVRGEDKAAGIAPVAVISYRLWQRNFGGDRTVIGRTLRINRHPYTIVGVAPPAFQGSESGLRSDLWIPDTMAAQIDSEDGMALLKDRRAGWRRCQTEGKTKKPEFRDHILPQCPSFRAPGRKSPRQPLGRPLV